MNLAFSNPKFDNLRALMVNIITPKPVAEEPEEVQPKRRRTVAAPTMSVGDDAADGQPEQHEATDDNKKKRRRRKHGENSGEQPESQPALPAQPENTEPALPASSKDNAVAETVVEMEISIAPDPLNHIIDQQGFRRSRSDDRDEGSYRSRSRAYHVDKDEKELEVTEFRRWFAVTKGGLLPDNEDLIYIVQIATVNLYI